MVIRNPHGRRLCLYLSGALAALPVSFTQISALAFVSLIPALLLFFGEWLASDTARPPRRYYGAGMWFSMGFFMVTFHWFLRLWPLDYVSGMTPFLALLVIFAACVLLPLLQSLGFSFLFWTLAHLSRTRAVRRLPLLLPLLFAGGWTIYAWTQNLTWMGVPWGTQLALSQHKNLLLCSSASFFGSYFVTFIIAAVNACLALGILWLAKREKRRASVAAGVAASLFLLNFGLSTLSYCLPQEKRGEIRAAVLQANLSSSEKWDDTTDAVSLYADLAKEAAKKDATLMIWPETAVTSTLQEGSVNRERVRMIAEETGATQVVGAFYYETGEDGARLRYNSLYVFRPDGSVSEQVYHKRHLVPFGEYVPMEGFIRAVFPALASLEMLQDGSQLTPGTSPALLEESFGTMGGLICFDTIYESLAHDSVAAGAELLVVGTNDSWFFDSAAVYQHNGQAVLRAVENGRALLRAANTGISSIITEKGEILSTIPPLVAGEEVATVNLCRGRTLYNRIGNLFVVLCGIFFLSPFAWEIGKRIACAQQNKKIPG